LKIATLNLQNYLEPPNAFYDFEQIYTVIQWDKKNHWIRRYLTLNNPDVIGFQEVFSCDALKLLVGDCGYDYFTVVSEPDVKDDFIYSNPVVAIASKYPIIDVSNLQYDASVVENINLSTSIPFVKRVMRATIELPSLGATDFYVAHFKSKRSFLTFEYNSLLTEEKNFTEYFKTDVAGRWASSVLRGTEAMLLQHEMLSRREMVNYPMVLLGDFNDELSGSILKTLTHDDVYEQPYRHNKNLIDKYTLKDSWNVYLANTSTESTMARASTHYFGGKGSVLDYILVSSEFDSTYSTHIYEIANHQTFDNHLINPNFDIDGCSTDHAVVEITLKLRS
jgi:endonuclease/exonuclease/phosphatase family metal-dependent hydrolase